MEPVEEGRVIGLPHPFAPAGVFVEELALGDVLRHAVAVEVAEEDDPVLFFFLVPRPLLGLLRVVFLSGLAGQERSARGLEAAIAPGAQDVEVLPSALVMGHDQVRQTVAINVTDLGQGIVVHLPPARQAVARQGDPGGGPRARLGARIDRGVVGCGEEQVLRAVAVEVVEPRQVGHEGAAAGEHRPIFDQGLEGQPFTARGRTAVGRRLVLRHRNCPRRRPSGRRAPRRRSAPGARRPRSR